MHRDELLDLARVDVDGSAELGHDGLRRASYTRSKKPRVPKGGAGYVPLALRLALKGAGTQAPTFAMFIRCAHVLPCPRAPCALLRGWQKTGVTRQGRSLTSGPWTAYSPGAITHRAGSNAMRPSP
jgi:hypothetical protein